MILSSEREADYDNDLQLRTAVARASKQNIKISKSQTFLPQFLACTITSYWSCTITRYWYYKDFVSNLPDCYLVWRMVARVANLS